ncbi:biotin transporter BioY [Neochlamydia sp. EPS4]|uniref:biotin transporter BioY n=1 Tax=Neochlamydia sp. EPS4 TaxID=1478175 RepID=UPI0005D0ED11|nr:biotin transporter BioY [Neochlamydia sp. EPS4]
MQLAIPSSFTLTDSWPCRVLISLAGSFLIALGAKVSLTLPFSPVPFTCQTLAVLFLGITLGSRQAAAATLLYLLEGTCGLPVFSPLIAQPLILIGPKAGYLLAMPLQAYLAGKASSQKSMQDNLVILTLACLLVLALGASILAIFVGGKNAIYLGLYPFLFSEVLKIFIAMGYLNSRKIQR